MIPAKFTLLGARRFGEVVSDPSATLDQIEGLFPLTGGIRSVLTTFNGPIVFEKGAKFTSVEPSPLSDVDGYQGLEMIYGLGTGANSILKQTATYSDQLPPSHFPIGEAPGGNLICVNTRGGVYFWNHESPEDGKLWTIAPSLDEFFNRLEVDDAKPASDAGIVDSGSFLDF